MVINPRKPTDKEWGMMRDMYCQGMNAGKIAQATGVFEGTIASRVSRHGWREVREAVRRALPPQAKVTVRLQTQADKDDKAAGTRARAQLGRIIEACIAKIGQPKTGAQALALQRELTPLVNNAARVFAWADRPDPVINLALIDRACLLSTTNVPQGTLSDQGSVRTITQGTPVPASPSEPQAQLSIPASVLPAESALGPAVPNVQTDQLAPSTTAQEATLILEPQQGP